ncbi:hypothetical protein BAT02nite_30620 [Bacillus atrophaeus]|nr:hypothetical protein BAT02nite_30620 [Bacillus atrophaeus]
MLKKYKNSLCHYESEIQEHFILCLYCYTKAKNNREIWDLANSILHIVVLSIREVSIESINIKCNKFT